MKTNACKSKNMSDTDLLLPTDKKIIDFIISWMKMAEETSTTGDLKKAFVVKKLKFFLGRESYGRYEPLLILLVDSLAMLAKNKTLLNGINTVQKNCLANCIVL